MRVVELRKKLSELKEKQTVARTRQQLLDEEKIGLLEDVQKLLTEIKKLDIVSETELTPQNLSNVIEKVRCHIATEIEKSSVPTELQS